jgi:hypothetical protein
VMQVTSDEHIHIRVPAAVAVGIAVVCHMTVVAVVALRTLGFGKVEVAPACCILDHIEVGLAAVHMVQAGRRETAM